MGFLDRLRGRSTPKDDGIYIYARCGRCGRVVHTRLNPQHELTPRDGGFESRKSLTDDRCFRPFSLYATFDAQRRLIATEIDGGEVIDRATWEAERDLPRRPPSPPPSHGADL